MWLKQDAISELEAAKTGDKKVDKAIDRVIADIEDSLDDKKGSLWIDASRLVTDEEGRDGFRGLKVFHEEKKAVTGGVNLPPEVEAVVTEVIDKLIKADQLLAKVAIHDAVNTPVVNPESQSKVDHHIAKAEEYLASSYDELANDRPDKAIKSLEQCWHHAQLAIVVARGQFELAYEDDDDGDEDEED